MFISSYTTIYFLVKKIIFSNVFISVNTIFKYVFGRERGHQLSTHVTGGEVGEVIQNGYNCIQGRGRHASCARTHTLTLSLFMCLAVFSSFQAFILYFKLFLRTKVSKNAFNFNQIES